ncbi:unnamed protein product [Cuscuta epithymum]|uniref:Transmembrane protein n=1 Tax=Cuscuta epithymum TaxID=186058 RepID=A0AAV0EFB8_9ASTE|nr:unnamed protein product [Cuscuta epithymum]
MLQGVFATAKKKHFSAFGFKKHLFTKHYQFLLFLGLRVKSTFPFSITQKTLILPNTTNFYFSKSLFSQTLSTFTTNHFFQTSPKVLFFKQKQLQTLPQYFWTIPLQNCRHGVLESLGFGNNILILRFASFLFFMIRLFIFLLITLTIARLLY